MTEELRAVGSSHLVLFPNPKLPNMKTARIRKGEGQVSLSVKLSRGGEMNETMSVTWDVQDAADALERYRPLSKMVMEAGAGKIPFLESQLLLARVKMFMAHDDPMYEELAAYFGEDLRKENV